MKVMNIGIIIRNDHDDTFPVALTPQMVSVIQNLLTQIPVLNSKLVDATGKKVASGQASIPIIPRNVEFDWDRAYSPMMPEEEQKLMAALQAKYKEDEANKTPEETEASDKAKTGGIIVPEGMGKDDDPENKITKVDGSKPAMFTDKDNPFNMTLDAKGRANVDMEEQADSEETAGAEVEAFDDAKAIEAGSDVIGQAGEETRPQLTKDHIEVSEEEEVEEMEDGIEKAAEGEEAGDCTVTPEPLKLSGDNKL